MLQNLVACFYSKRFKEFPIRVRLLVIDLYLVSGKQNVQAVWKEPNLHTKAYKILAVVNMNKMPKDTLAFHVWDDSGHHAQPHPESDVHPDLRIDYLTYSSVAKFLVGEGLQPFANRFTGNLTKRLLARQQTLSSDWSYQPDLFKIMQTELFPAAVQAMCGTRIFEVNEDFTQNFWAFNEVLPLLAKGYPRWLVPSAYRARDTVIKSLQKWHRAIAHHFKTESTGSMADWNPEYGAEFVKFRHVAYSKMPRMGPGGAATEDLGMIWA